MGILLDSSQERRQSSDTVLDGAYIFPFAAHSGNSRLLIAERRRADRERSESAQRLTVGFGRGAGFELLAAFRMELPIERLLFINSNLTGRLRPNRVLTAQTD